MRQARERALAVFSTFRLYGRSHRGQIRPKHTGWHWACGRFRARFKRHFPDRPECWPVVRKVVLLAQDYGAFCWMW